MFAIHSSIVLYPYPYKTFAAVLTMLMLIIVGLPVYGIYRLIIRKMTERGKAIFHKALKGAGICLLALFFVQLTLALITEHQVNMKLGFSYATPDIPEGEFFIITKVVPGGIMAKAGIKVGDRVLLDSTFKLYRILIRNQGREAEFMILRDEKEITIRVKVPEIELTLRKFVKLY
jgi:hypothetical protein